MQIEEGSYYCTRDGRRVGPISRARGRCAAPYVWQVANSDLYKPSWTARGRFLSDEKPHHLDLVSEWPRFDPAVTPTLAQDGQTTVAGTETAADVETPSTGAGNEKPMTGFYDALNPDQKQAAKDYRGPEAVGGPRKLGILASRLGNPAQYLDDMTVSPASFDVFTDLDVKPLRVQLLGEGAALTNGARDREYGPPALNMACSGELKAVFRKHMRREISDAEMEALDMVLTKVGRLATGNPKRDTYVDAATYMAIAGEIALTEGK